MSNEVPTGRYEVAIETFIDFRVYPRKGRNPGEKPWMDRMQEAKASTEPLTVRFEGRRFRWHPGVDDVLPTVSVPIQNPENDGPERAAMRRFLSALSYQYGYGITIYSEAGSGFKKEFDPPLLVQPRMKPTTFSVPDEVKVSHSDGELNLCLALMREGASSTSRALKYLSYWKTIEVAVGDRTFRSWIGPTAKDVNPSDSRSAEDWYKHLNETRIAAAHALPTEEKFRHDPDDPSTSIRLEDDLGTVRKLAKRAVENRWPNAVIVKGTRYNTI